MMEYMNENPAVPAGIGSVLATVFVYTMTTLFKNGKIAVPEFKSVAATGSLITCFSATTLLLATAAYTLFAPAYGYPPLADSVAELPSLTVYSMAVLPILIFLSFLAAILTKYASN